MASGDKTNVTAKRTCCNGALRAVKALGFEEKPKKLDAVLPTGVYRRIGSGRITAYLDFGCPIEDACIPAEARE